MEELGAGEELMLFLPMRSFVASADVDWGRVWLSFVLSFVRILFLCDFFGAHHIFLGQAGAEGKGELDRPYVSTNKQKVSHLGTQHRSVPE